MTAALYDRHIDDTRLILAAVCGMAAIVLLISWLKLHPFLALAVGSLTMGFGAGLGAMGTVASFTNGFGTTMGSVGVLIGLGAMFGKLLADSGGADRIVDALLDWSSERLLPWTMALIGALIGLPLFFEVGLVLLMPVILLVSRRSQLPVMRIAMPALAGLSTMHCLVPPHPGPLVAVTTLHANLGVTLAFGAAISIPVITICGPLFGAIAARWVPVPAPAHLFSDQHRFSDQHCDSPAPADPARTSFARALTAILLPVALMLGRSIAEIVSPNSTSPLRGALDVLGTPLIALGIGLLAGAVLLGMPRNAVAASLDTALAPVAGVIMMIGSGGGFKQVLIDAGISQAIVKAATGSHLPVLLLGWLVAALIRLATGSATVATVAASGVLTPLTAGLTPAHTALLVLAVGAGSVFFSHVNDAGFWMVKGYFDLSVPQTLKTWTAVQTLISTTGLLFVLLLGVIT